MDIAQIQIVPVENGYFIQCINIDGSGTNNPRRVANSKEELASQIKELAELLYTKEPVKYPAQTAGQPGPPDQTPSEGTAPKV
jgi:hypothetical protein